MANQMNCGSTDPDRDTIESDRIHQKRNNLINVVEVKSITNIHYDCLEHIFDRLDSESFLNLADTCERLRIAAAAKFVDDHSERYVFFYPIRDCAGLGIRPNAILVFGLKFCFQFLRCFGDKISKLGFFYLTAEDYHLEQYISKYCADSLTAIQLDYVVELAFSKPFKHVESVSLNYCKLDKQLTSIVNLFPNMRTLRLGFRPLEQVTMTDLLNFINKNPSITGLHIVIPDATAVHARELNRFVDEHPLMIKFGCFNYRFTADDAIKFLRHMKSLKSLRFHVKDQSEADRLINELGNEWNYTASNGVLSDTIIFHIYPTDDALSIK